MADESIHDGSSTLAKLKSGSGMGMVEEGGEGEQDVSGEGQVGAAMEVGEQGGRAGKEGLSLESRFGKVSTIQ